jgi:autotransporter-associated beta strand protein
MFRSPRSWFPRWLTPCRSRLARRSHGVEVRLKFDKLEDRTVPTTITVANLNNSGSGSLADAITSLNNSPGTADAIAFDPSLFTGGPQSITLTNNSLPKISDSLTITGPAPVNGVPQLTITHSAFSSVRTFDIGNSTGNLQVTLKWLDIDRGSVFGGGTGNSGDDGLGGGIRFVGAAGGNSLTIIGCAITNNIARAANLSNGNAEGGGVYTSNVAVTMSASSMTGNTAFAGASSTAVGTAKGGGMFCSGGSVTISGSTIGSIDLTVAPGNTAKTQNPPSGINATGDSFGGGLDTENTTLSLTDTTIAGNNATGSSGNKGGNAQGGGLYHIGMWATLLRCTISGNIAQGGNASQLTNNFYGSYSDHLPANAGSADGGGLAVIVSGSGSDGIVSMTDSQVSSNQSKGGTATGELDHGSDYGGVASNGGMDAETRDASGNLTINGTATGCSFDSNQATGGNASSSNDSDNVIGGGAYAGGVTVANLIDSTVSGNSATGGSAVASHFGSLVLPGPAAGGGFGGGAIFASLPVVYRILNSTIASNVASSEVRDSANNVTLYWQAIGGGVSDGTVDQFGTITPDANKNVGVYSSLIARNSVDSTDPLNPIGGGINNYAFCPDIFEGFSYHFDATYFGHNFIGDTDYTQYNNFPQIGFNGPDPIPNNNNDIVGPHSNLATPYDPLFTADPNSTAYKPWLGYFGGVTQSISLQSISPAIDAGQDDNGLLSNDQRDTGFVRTNAISGGTAANYSDGTDVGAFEVQSQPNPLVYVDTHWADTTSSPHPFGTVIPDADPVAPSLQPATIGINAFATIGAALSHVASGGEIIINGSDGSSGSGVFNEAVVANQLVTLYLQGGPVTINSLAGNASGETLELHGVNLTTGGDNSDTSFQGAISGSGGLTKVGNGAFTLAGANTYTGATTVNAGRLVAGSSSAFGNGSAVSLADAGTLSLNGYNVPIGSLAGTGTVNDYASSAGTLTVGNSNSTTFGGMIVNGPNGSLSMVKVGSGTLTLIGNSNSYTGGTTINGTGAIQVGAGSTFGVLPGNVVDNANLIFSHSDAVNFGGIISGTGALVQLGAGTLTLTGANTYSGGTTMVSGLSVPNGANINVGSGGSLGTGTVTITGFYSAFTTVTYTATNTAHNTFVLDNGTLSAPSGVTLTLNGGQISGGFLAGSGTFATSAANGATFEDMTSLASVTIASNNASDQFVNFTNSATLNVAAGINTSGAGTTTNFSSFLNQGLGSITIGAASRINVANFQSYGVLTLNPAAVGNPNNQATLITNTGTSALTFSNGSRTYIGTAATTNSGGSPTFVAGVDLNGKNAEIYDGLVVNYGFVMDSSSGGTGTATLISDYNSLVKGNGFFQNPVITLNGGRVQAGDCPGKATFGGFTFGPEGVDNYLFQIDDAAGVAGPSPDSTNHLDGWSLVSTGNFSWTATTNHKLTIGLQTLSSTSTEGNDIVGTMDNFDPTQSYSWAAVKWTGTYTGPTDVATLNAATTFDTSAVVNAAGGKFSWRLDTAAQTLSLVYTPPPAVAAVQLNDSGSGVQSMTVTFSTAVSFAGGNAAAAFRLTNVDTGAAVTLSAVISTDSQGRTVVTLTFSGDETNSLGALLSGRYALTVIGSAVTGANGVALDGTGTGTGNGIDYLGQTWIVG